MTAQPTGEVVEEGGKALFIAGATGATAASWRFVSPNGNETLDAAGVRTRFSGLKVSGEATGTLTLDNIPLSFSGWKVDCYLSNAVGGVRSAAAGVTVNAKKAASTDAASSAVSGEDEDAEKSEAKTRTGKTTSSGSSSGILSAAASSSEEAHDHDFSILKSATNETHTFACACGEVQEATAHSLQARVEGEAVTEEAALSACAVCGYEMIQATVKNQTTGLPVWAIVLLVVAFAAMAIIIIVLLFRPGRRGSGGRRNKKRKRVKPLSEI